MSEIGIGGSRSRSIPEHTTTAVMSASYNMHQIPGPCPQVSRSTSASAGSRPLEECLLCTTHGPVFPSSASSVSFYDFVTGLLKYFQGLSSNSTAQALPRVCQSCLVINRDLNLDGGPGVSKANLFLTSLAHLEKSIQQFKSGVEIQLEKWQLGSALGSQSKEVYHQP